jgi:hypothetical protein
MEIPNLSFIKEIAGDDEIFQKRILEIIKTEFTEEVSLFKTNFSLKKYEDAANDVHKIKHKISLLALAQGSEKASEFEKELKEGIITSYPSFLEVLNKIHVYLSN